MAKPAENATLRNSSQISISSPPGEKHKHYGLENEEKNHALLFPCVKPRIVKVGDADKQEGENGAVIDKASGNAHNVKNEVLRLEKLKNKRIYPENEGKGVLGDGPNAGFDHAHRPFIK